MVKIIYAGYSKCGTTTIAQAFRSINYKVYDYEEVILYHAADWIKYWDADNYSLEERRKHLRNMFKDIDVVTDSPHYFYWRELLDAFPDAKVIFWERPEQPWLKSMVKQIESITESVLKPDIICDIFKPFSALMREKLKFNAYLMPIMIGSTPFYMKKLTGKTSKINEIK